MDARIIETKEQDVKILREGRRLLEAGDVNGYWDLMAQHSDYAKAAGEVARGEGVLGDIFNERLQQKARDNLKRELTGKELAQIRIEIADADLETRENNLRQEGHIGVDSDQADKYHKEVFGKRGLPEDTFAPSPFQATIGGFWSKIVGKGTWDVRDKEWYEVFDEIEKRYKANPDKFMKDALEALGVGASAAEDAADYYADELWEGLFGSEARPEARPEKRGADPFKGGLDIQEQTPDTPRQERPAPSGAPGQRSGLEEGKAAARAGSGADLAASPEGLRFLAALEPKAGEEVEEVLLKPVDQWTKGEMGALMDDPDYWRTAMPRGRLLQDKARAWHDHFFGTGPAPEDETGRMLPARPAHPIPTSPAAVRAADGGDLAGSVLGIGKRVLAAAAESSLSEAIRGLQGGLNGLQTGDLNGLAGVRSGAVGMDRPALAVDGIFGPRTRRRLRGALAALGWAPVEKGFARSFARFRPAGSSIRPRPRP